MLYEKILELYFSLPKPTPPNGVEVIYPFDKQETKRVMEIFFKKFYSDTKQRKLLFGINPGRFGAGVTGIGFSDSVILEEKLGITNSFEKKKELSAQFIYEVVEAYGGAKKFYGDFLFTTTLPFGLLKNAKNYNYYDDKETLSFFEPLIVESIQKQLNFTNVSHDIICVGSGKNLKYLQVLNEKHGFFTSIEVVPHPRWVMQYRRKEKEKYIQEYLKTLHG